MLSKRFLVQQCRIAGRAYPFRHLSPTIQSPDVGIHLTLPPRQPRIRFKSTKTVLVKDLPQGFLDNENVTLPDLEPDEGTQYPAVVQGARNNMLKYKDCVILTRVGKFYELYLEQAEEYAPKLDIKLASKKTKDGRVAMAGFPCMQLDKYLRILVLDNNKNVAISEEYLPADGKAASPGLMFDRIVKRIVTPGTLIDESFLDPNQNNYLMAIYIPKLVESQPEHSSPFDFTKNDDTLVGLAWTDLSTGEFSITSTALGNLSNILARVNAKEVLLDPSWEPSAPEYLKDNTTHTLTYIKPDQEEGSVSDWGRMFEVPNDLANISLTSVEASAIHLLLSYCSPKVDTASLKLQCPARPDFSNVMSIDRSTLRGLEVLETSRDGLHQGSLLHAVRRTVTKGGARLLRSRLVSPSASLEDIESRLDLTSVFLAHVLLRQELVAFLQRTHDTIRLVQKIALNRCEPDDLICLGRAIEASQGINEALSREIDGSDVTLSTAQRIALEGLRAQIDLEGPLRLAKRVFDAIDEDGLDQMHRQEEEAELEAIDMTKRAITSGGSVEDMDILPAKSRRGKATQPSKAPIPAYEDTWIMRRSASTALKKLHGALDELKRQKERLTQDLAERLGAPSLTLRWSPSLSYFAHVKGGDKKSLDHLNARVISSTKSTRSLAIPEWQRLGADMDQAKSHIRDEEQKVFHRLRDDVRGNIIKLRRNARVIDEIDVACSFAKLAEENQLVRPIMTDSNTHKIYGGRHPTVELGLARSGRPFVRNDCILDTKERMWLVTGPNMAGKSTFLRQNAVISIMAQVGSYVPADYAELGIVDKIFSRVGAADDVYQGLSTFMVEMKETASILKQATPRSFVIMDEVGRGTSPGEGTAIAYACLHHLHHVNRSRTLFATHFHDLADMTQSFEHLAPYCTRVDAEEDGSFSFVHRLERGVNRQSHALDVARIAGLPEQALSTAAAVLDQMQNGQGGESPEHHNHTAIAQVAAHG